MWIERTPRTWLGSLVVLLFLWKTATGCLEACICAQPQPGQYITNCQGRSLSEIPDGIPDNTVTLGLGMNRLTSVPGGIFSHLTNMRAIYLQQNMITSIEDGAFEGLINCEVLFLHDNNITHISANTFIGLDSLSRLTLHENMIYSIDQGAFNFPLLSEITLSSNHLVCDCSLGWFQDWSLNVSDKVRLDKITCASPTSLAGEELTAISRDSFVCPWHCDAQGQACYRFFQDLKTLEEANATCAVNGSHLATLYSNATMLFFQEIVLNDIDIYDAPYWIDANDRDTEGTWVDANNNELMFAPWATGQPDSAAGEEDCSTIRCREDGTCVLDDQQCNDRFRYICAYDLCPAENLTTTRGVFSWPATQPNHTAELDCPHTINGLTHKMASRYCSKDSSSGPEWEAPVIYDCPYHPDFTTGAPPTPLPTTSTTTIRLPTAQASTDAPDAVQTTQQEKTTTRTTTVTSSTTLPTTENITPTTTAPATTTHASTTTVMPTEPEMTTDADVPTTQPDDHHMEGPCAEHTPSPDNRQFPTPGVTVPSVILLEDLVMFQPTIENVDQLSARLSSLTEQAVEFSPREIENAVDTLSGIVSLDELSEEASANGIKTVSNLLVAMESSLFEAELKFNSTKKMLDAVGALSMKVNFQSEVFRAVSEHVGILVLNLTAPDDVNGLRFSEIGANMTATLSQGRVKIQETVPGAEEIDDITASFEFPASLVQYARAMGETRMQFAIYPHGKIFQILERAAKVSQLVHNSVEEPVIDGDRLNSRIISATVGHLELKDLSDPVKLVFTHVQHGDNPECVWWDMQTNGGMGGWSSEGCWVDVTENGQTDCYCDHLTNFALLMDVYGTSARVSKGHQTALSVISYIGCGVSLIGIFLSLLTFGMFKKVRRETPTKILINLCVALFMVNALFVSLTSIHDLGIDELCMSFAVLMHYFLLAAMMWMGLEALNMYIALVKVFNTYYKRFMFKLALAGWGIPAVVVGITLGIDHKSYGPYEGICWLSRYAFLGAFLAPALFIIIVNFIIFTMVIRTIVGLEDQKKLKKSTKTDTATKLKGAVGLSILLGLTWALAIFAIREANVVINYLFAIFNSLQGLFIFIFHCVMKKDVQNNWRRMIPCCPNPPPGSTAWSTRSHMRANRTRSSPVSNGSMVRKFSQSESTTSLAKDKREIAETGLYNEAYQYAPEAFNPLARI
ncbi:adhesion G-protein coupled receptor G2-like isoform X2 [Branchiostoma floridae]|uniref:Adhesion G-protein coupled receptor G2-like isoform X2 n=1 Tax=Branchiostoma floridae TaxID=7739 RepID=A0A9J7N0E6_BRAFL|nr:adhesion G-protein coupled receptor G2-like isoform X2 [Branchiostoma floridae]